MRAAAIGLAAAATAVAAAFLALPLVALFLRVPPGDLLHAAGSGVFRDALVVSQETDVKGIVSKIALDEADAGFVYRTDARPVAAHTRTIALPAWAQPPIRYELAVVKASEHRAAAKAFVAKVLSKRGRLLLSRAGFGLPHRP